jgi:Pyridoxamine 5'-phosphate oxidase
MATWGDFERAEPAFAERVRGLFDAGRHKTIATIRADGSPRISGIECVFVDGNLQFGTMTSARKLADLLRDPRFALHGPTFHPEPGKEQEWSGEAKVAGRAVHTGPIPTHEEASESTGEPQPSGELFVADIAEVVITGLNAQADKLVIEYWTPLNGLRRIERD